MSVALAAGEQIPDPTELISVAGEPANVILELHAVPTVTVVEDGSATFALEHVSVKITVSAASGAASNQSASASRFITAPA